ncbi:PDZ domain-containing protein [Salibacterium salarium]|uniref:PDZ domain-containing protein n=1 Tax=Salibacterium salarium TaxID=284579 RepID=A0A428N1R2_9BACI|nr:trypsin-like peptidase domain-containing protein [Salibacterium salarium]RSL32381.1 PDZ domain-containing protein [Salibacterium salarium]
MAHFKDYENQENHVEEEQKHHGKDRKRAGFTGFIGALIGAIIVAAAMPLVYSDNMFSTDAANNTEETETTDMNTGGQSSEPAVEEMSTQSVSVSSEVTSAVNEVSDAVVGIFSLQQGGLMQEQGENQAQGAGSGVIYKKEGDSAFIVTNNHVIDGASRVEVGLSNDQRVEAEIVGTDALTDLAVLRISSENVDTVAEFGDSDALSTGEPAIAIGNPLGENLNGTVTQGIISSVDRSIPVDTNGDGQTDWNSDVLQTDAAINPGNSGGALVNIEGQLIGINSMKIAQSAVEGIGFAIPSNTVKPILEDLEANGQVERPQLGVTIGSLSEVPSYHWQETLNLPEGVEQGVFINSVQPGSAAESAELQQYDVITAINGQEIADGHDLRGFLYNDAKIDETIEITFYRNGEQQTTELTLGETGTQAG